MSKWVIVVALIAIIGCSSEDDLYGAGFITVSETSWATTYTHPYPFTVSEGEISCGVHPAFGREVYFEPKGHIDESSIGIPLNKTAVDAISQRNLTVNVPYSIKDGADLSEAINIGLNVCDEQRDMLANHWRYNN